jgi:hypothetical protein
VRTVFRGKDSGRSGVYIDDVTEHGRTGRGKIGGVNGADPTGTELSEAKHGNGEERKTSKGNEREKERPREDRSKLAQRLAKIKQRTIIRAKHSGRDASEWAARQSGSFSTADGARSPKALGKAPLRAASWSSQHVLHRFAVGRGQRDVEQVRNRWGDIEIAHPFEFHAAPDARPLRDEDTIELRIT